MCACPCASRGKWGEVIKGGNIIAVLITESSLIRPLIMQSLPGYREGRRGPVLNGSISLHYYFLSIPCHFDELKQYGKMNGKRAAQGRNGRTTSVMFANMQSCETIAIPTNGWTLCSCDCLKKKQRVTMFCYTHEHTIWQTQEGERNVVYKMFCIGYRKRRK